jgi:holo-[acyl-carrier protein] synthase
MISGIGTDICSIKRVVKAHEKQGDRFAKRVLSEVEFERDFQTQANPTMKARLLAKRWAIKEAIAKALGTGIGKQCSFQDITVSHDSLGKPIVDDTSTILQRFPTTNFLISVSDETDYCVAFAVCEQQQA